MRAFPEEFEVKLLQFEKLGVEDLDQLETGVIEIFKERGAPLYNKNRGAGGGHARKGLRF